MVVAWRGLKADGETPASMEAFAGNRRAVQVEGDLAGATLNITGSADNIHFHCLPARPLAVKTLDRKQDRLCLMLAVQ